jgi:hypothetical protein
MYRVYFSHKVRGEDTVDILILNESQKKFLDYLLETEAFEGYSDSCFSLDEKEYTIDLT